MIRKDNTMEKFGKIVAAVFIAVAALAVVSFIVAGVTWAVLKMFGII